MNKFQALLSRFQIRDQPGNGPQIMPAVSDDGREVMPLRPTGKPVSDGREVMPLAPTAPKPKSDGRQVMPLPTGEPVKVTESGPQIQPALSSFNRPAVLGLGRRVERQYSSRPFGTARDDQLF